MLRQALDVPLFAPHHFIKLIMGTILASVVLTKAHTVLQDASAVRWTQDELISWLNDGQREVVIYKPNACTVVASLRLAPGTLQSLPTDGIQLIDLPRNRTGAGGAAPGRAIRITGRETLDATLPDWHTSEPSATVKHYMYTMLSPLTFWVYPPQPSIAMGYVDIIYGAVPADVSTSQPISINDIYQNALVDYVLYRAFSKDSEVSASNERATAHYNSFISSVGGKIKVEAGVNPNTTAPATTPQASQP